METPEGASNYEVADIGVALAHGQPFESFDGVPDYYEMILMKQLEEPSVHGVVALQDDLPSLRLS